MYYNSKCISTHTLSKERAYFFLIEFHFKTYIVIDNIFNTYFYSTTNYYHMIFCSNDFVKNFLNLLEYKLFVSNKYNV